jgi:hypothetical protein
MSGSLAGERLECLRSQPMIIEAIDDGGAPRASHPEQPGRLVVLFRNPRRATSERPACPSITGWKWYRAPIELDMVHLRPHFVRTGSGQLPRVRGAGHAPLHRFLAAAKSKGHNCSPVDHRDGVIPNIADAHLALRLHLLQIFPSFDRCFFQVPIRAS